jgi:hypothetical protein
MAGMRARRPPLHPFLFALFPLVSLYAKNSGILGPRSLAEPIAYALLCAAALYGAALLLLRDRRRAAIAASLIILAFFFYPTFIGALAMVWLPPASGGLFAWAAALAGVLLLIARTRADLVPITKALNAVAAVAVLVPMAGLSPALWAAATTVAAASTERAERAAAPAGAPDVYYIVLDGYARQDVLAEYYGFDNREFIDGLRQRGFYVADQSRSNYSQTYLSLASSLNQTYLDDVVARVGRANDDRTPLGDMIAGNRAAEVLRRRGYTFVAFSSGYTGTEIRDADVYVEAPVGLSEFQHLLFDSTPLAAVSATIVGGDVRYAAHRNRVLHTLDGLAPPDDAHRPAFVFAHVYAPHPPFVFGADGEMKRWGEPFSLRDGITSVPSGPAEYVARYRQQVAFLNRKVMEALDRILASSPPPIVIVQSDHGPGSRWDDLDVAGTDHFERMAILNAYHFPDRRYDRLYPTITPVNSFRVVLSQYFGQADALLPDRSYSSTWTTPYDLVDVTGVELEPRAPALLSANDGRASFQP